MVSIDGQPAIVDKKLHLGSQKIDTAIGKGFRGIFIVAVERQSKNIRIGRAPYKQVGLVARAIIRTLRPFKKYVLTITIDIGKEFSQHQRIAKALKVGVYFVHPCSTQERMLYENTNGLLNPNLSKYRLFRVTYLLEVVIAQVRLDFSPRKILWFKALVVLFAEYAAGTI